jgi:hypothetical protein
LGGGLGGCGAGEVEGGDLDAAEEVGGALEIDVAAGDAAEDFEES